MKKIIFISCIMIFFSACKQDKENQKDKISVQTAEIKPVKLKEEYENYRIYTPDSIGLTLKDFDVNYSHRIGNNIVAVVYDLLDNGESNNGDMDHDWGDRLLYLNNKNEIIYKAKGVGDPFMYKPYFFKNDKNGNIIVICQLGYEYAYGGDVYLIKNDTIKQIGNIDLESIDPEVFMVNMVNIKESDKAIVFTFNSDSLILKPGSEHIRIKNNNTRYEYRNNSFKLIK
ncbi:hypothetical protein [Flavobacterium cerinum]|uniref:Lipoprotein n=1 Tax=Flavobacterium cerinum TaxID=2502784 RepID=A0ABY5IT65_9FLAO|nr:hypothetical protein [Flavobacterium cerinum]UUC44717.1 hypothetical protein NOX80_13885 [Flavobacterium cerinum]